jgi:hypothetical protein
VLLNIKPGQDVPVFSTRVCKTLLLNALDGNHSWVRPSDKNRLDYFWTRQNEKNTQQSKADLQLLFDISHLFGAGLAIITTVSCCCDVCEMKLQYSHLCMQKLAKCTCLVQQSFGVQLFDKWKLWDNRPAKNTNTLKWFKQKHRTSSRAAVNVMRLPCAASCKN